MVHTDGTSVGAAIDSDAGAEARSLLSVIAARFTAAWEATGSPPDLAEFLPDAPGLRRLCLIELIKVDLEYRWIRYDFPKRLAEYRTEYDELRHGPLPPDLAYEEFHALRRSGRGPDHSGYPTEAGSTAAAWETRDYRSTLIARPAAVEALEGIEVGDRVDDFDLLVELGAGAFARVFLARQRSMQRLVAVKVSQNHGTESETLAQLDHENIVRVFDQRLLAERELKLLYMQYIPGGTLSKVLRLVRERPPEQRSGGLLLEAVDAAMRDKGGLVPGESQTRLLVQQRSWPETVAWLGSRLARALDYAADNGVLHRDIKPANILLTVDGVPKLADFNISFSSHVAGTSPLAYFGGSLAYMSPEQLAACHPQLPDTAEDLDGRSDIYALGVVLWELLTGKRPFDDETRAGDSESSLERMLALRRQVVDPARLEDLPPDCPPTLRRVLLRCLAPRRADRWPTGAALAQQLDLVLDHRARDLVDPPADSWRARVGPWSLLVLITVASAAGGVVGAVYTNLHNGPLWDLWFSEQEQHTLRVIGSGMALFSTSAAVGLTNYLCRKGFFVWRGLRKGRTYAPEKLARGRLDTLRDGDRVAVVAFAWWVASALVASAAMIAFTDLAPGRMLNLAATLLVSGAIAVAYPFFVVTFFVVRCFYPRLLSHGETANDHHALRALGRRCTMYLVVAAALPLIGVVISLIFLTPHEVSLVIDPIKWLCLVAVLGFVLDYWLFRRLEADLRAFERAFSDPLMSGSTVRISPAT
ncbi:serine/threonine protein kinase [Nocardia sp. 2]|uniref:Serine/threonine protein kinase n=1 Tax=Nocardia acididurans TaxID=2802282 RepID=A0ABS1LYH1_9NOCA|nr:serine/threonine-protein kinase [Nocardia acididurans]MBL1073286.1 serine/threonine protein kinase [Nocardia acididurans]